MPTMVYGLRLEGQAMHGPWGVVKCEFVLPAPQPKLLRNLMLLHYRSCDNCGRDYRPGDKWYEVQFDKDLGTYKIIPYWFSWSTPHPQFCRGRCVGSYIAADLEYSLEKAYVDPDSGN